MDKPNRDRPVEAGVFVNAVGEAIVETALVDGFRRWRRAGAPGPPAETEWLKAATPGRPIRVDRESNIVLGYVVAQGEPFKTLGRGEFDKNALKEIVKLMKAAPNGLKVRFQHPTESDDGLGKFLGRARNPRLDTITERDSEGRRKDDEIAVVRADLHFDSTSLEEPVGGGRPLGDYVMALAESDPDAFSTSLTLTVELEYRIDKKGRPLKDEEGNELPPLWRPQALHSSDVVDTGDAVDGFLSSSVDGVAGGLVHQGVRLLDRQFKNKSAAFVRERCIAWLDRYLDYRYGECDDEPLDLDGLGVKAPQPAPPGPKPDPPPPPPPKKPNISRFRDRARLRVLEGGG